MKRWFEAWRPEHGLQYDLTADQKGWFDSSLAVSLMDAGGPLLSFGMTCEYGFGTRCAWLFRSPRLTATPMQWRRIIGEIRDGLNRVECHRIEAYTDSESRVNGRFIGFLGFEREGFCRNYFGRGKHAILWARCAE